MNPEHNHRHTSRRENLKSHTEFSFCNFYLLKVVLKLCSTKLIWEVSDNSQFHIHRQSWKEKKCNWPKYVSIPTPFSSNCIPRTMVKETSVSFYSWSRTRLIYKQNMPNRIEYQAGPLLQTCLFHLMHRQWIAHRTHLSYPNGGKDDGDSCPRLCKEALLLCRIYK